MQKNKIVLAGGSGYIGQTLVRYFSGSGSSTKQLCEVVVLTRDKKRIQDDRIKYVYWDGKTLGEWAHELEGARAVILSFTMLIDVTSPKAAKSCVNSLSEIL